MRRQALLLIGICLAIGLAFGLLWTGRLDAPRDAWWKGKKPYVHVEVWEPGRDMATVGMTIPKSVLDFLRGMGLPAVISIGDEGDSRRVEFDEFWDRLQRLREGERLTFEEEGGTVHIWIDLKERRVEPGGSERQTPPEAPIETRL